MAKQIVAIEKRLKISQAQQNMILEVLIASLIVGSAIVVMIWLVKYIGFNNKIITEQGNTIVAYENTIRNVGVCNPGNDNKFSDSELDKCDPNTINIDDLNEDTLRYNVLNNMSNNFALESVARDSLGSCYDGNEKIDYKKEYEKATTDAEKEQALNMISLCSALRVIPDALPGQENLEATMASLNQIFILTGLEPESLTTVDENSSLEVESGVSGNMSESLGVTPVLFSVKSSSKNVQNLLSNLEKSIRTFDAQLVNFEWSGGALTADVTANAYFSNELSSKKATKTVYGGDKATTVTVNVDNMAGEE